MLWSAPYAVIARGVLLSVWLKKLYILRKINFFIKKKVEKICTYQKNVVPLHSKTKGSVGLQAFTERIRQ